MKKIIYHEIVFFLQLSLTENQRLRNNMTDHLTSFFINKS